jgi:DNA-binding transcriptional LysR family regulator
MDLDQLIAFERVTREGSFSRAALTLDITQPTISARIQALEQSIGGTLFVRGGRRITLTELGEEFLPYARRALEVLAEGVEAARLTQIGQRGRITIGTLESLSGGFLASTIARFHTSHPDIEIFVRTGHSEQLVEMLRDGTVKVGLLAWSYATDDMSTLLRFRETLELVVPANHALAALASVTLADVERLARPLLIVRWNPMIDLVLSRIDTQTRPVVEVPIDTVQYLLRRGVGAAFLTRTLVSDDLAAGRLVALSIADLPSLTRDSALVRLARGGPLPASVADFVAVLHEEAGALVVER